MYVSVYNPYLQNGPFQVVWEQKKTQLCHFILIFIFSPPTYIHSEGSPKITSLLIPCDPILVVTFTF